MSDAALTIYSGWFLTKQRSGFMPNVKTFASPAEIATGLAYSGEEKLFKKNQYYEIGVAGYNERLAIFPKLRNFFIISSELNGCTVYVLKREEPGCAQYIVRDITENYPIISFPMNGKQTEINPTRVDLEEFVENFGNYSLKFSETVRESGQKPLKFPVWWKEGLISAATELNIQKVEAEQVWHQLSIEKDWPVKEDIRMVSEKEGLPAPTGAYKEISEDLPTLFGQIFESPKPVDETIKASFFRAIGVSTYRPNYCGCGSRSKEDC